MDIASTGAHPPGMEDHPEQHAEQNELGRVLDSLPVLVWTALPDGQVDFLNHRWCGYTGLTHEEASGAGWQIAIHADDLLGVVDRWQSILASGEPGKMEARL